MRALALCLTLLTAPVAGAGVPAAGRVTEARFHSDALGVDKRYLVYLPAGYDSGSKRYPVLYYLHGLGGLEDDWSRAGDLGAIADRFRLEALVVMPDGDASFYSNSVAPSDWAECSTSKVKPFRPDETRESFCVREPRYEDYLTIDLVKHVDATYRTIAERRGRGIAGLSMGGFGALMLAMRHPDRFAAAASHSGVDALLYAGPHPYDPARVQLVTDVSRWGENVPMIGVIVRRIFGADLANWRAHDPAVLAASLKDGQLALYLDCGTGDNFTLQDGAAYLHDVLTRAGVKHQFALLPGRHDFGFWRARLPESLGFFRRSLAPAK